MSETVLLVGCGNMGRAMLEGWLAAKPALAAYVVEPADALRDKAADLGANVAAAPGDLPGRLAAGQPSTDHCDSLAQRKPRRKSRGIRPIRRGAIIAHRRSSGVGPSPSATVVCSRNVPRPTRRSP